MHVMRSLRRHRATLARQEPIGVARRPRFDHHWPLEANQAVDDLAVVMPRHALSGRKAQHLDAQIGALGDQLSASDRIIAAAARLDRFLPSLPRETLRDTSRHFLS